MANKVLTYANEVISAQSHAALFNSGISDGILYGCNTTGGANNTVTIGAGMFVACGRICQIDSSTTISLGSSQTSGYCLVKCVLPGQSNIPVFEVVTGITDPNSPITLTQSDINNNGDKYEIAWVLVKLSANANPQITRIINKAHAKALGIDITIPNGANDWDANSEHAANEQIIKVDGVTPTSNVILTGTNVRSEMEAFKDADIMAVDHGFGWIKVSCAYKPSTAIHARVLLL